MAQVVRPCGAVDEDVIEKHKDEPAEEDAQNVVHERLERRWGIAQPERHHKELVEAVMCAERRLGDVVGVHADLVVARTKVQLGEEPGTVQLVQQLVDHRDRVRILDGDGVEGSVVDAEAP